MRPRIIQKLSERLRSLMKSADDWGVSHEPDIATLGLVERVRDEWQQRDHPVVDQRFDLGTLLRALDERRRANAGKPRSPVVQPLAERLPDERLDRTGRRQPLDAEFFGRKRYVLEDLTGFPDDLFLKVAYRCLLKRDADAAGTEAVRSALRKGDLDRAAILEALRTSHEGISQGVAISGLRPLLIWRRGERIRFIGRAIGWVHAVVDARRLAQHVRRLEASDYAHASRLLEINRHLVGLTASIARLEESRVETETAFFGLATRFRRLRAEFELRVGSVAADDREWHESAEDEDAARRIATRIERLELALAAERARVDALVAELAGVARDRSDPIHPSGPT